MPYPQDTVPAGWVSLIGGMDAGRVPTLIAEDRYALGVNITVRGGNPRTRPSLARRDIVFQTAEEEAYFKTQLYQGGFYYKPLTGIGQLIAAVGGRLWAINRCTLQAVEITPGGPYGRSNRCVPLCYFVQAEQYLVVQNGIDLPVIYDGGISRRSNGETEIPVGTIMAYGQGRIWLVRANTVAAGDIVGGPTSVIDFTERLETATGGDVSPSYTIGPIRALVFAPQQDTQAGQGSLLVGGELGVTSIYADRKRTEWADGISRVTLLDIGFTGHRSVAPINGDVWFRATDGDRSYRQARAEIQNWARVPMSVEMQPFIERETPWLLPFSSSIKFDNRMLRTTSPKICNGRVSFSGLVVLDFQILSQLGQSATPAWDGIWTGANFLELVQAESEAFAFYADENGETALMQLASDAQRMPYDGTPAGGGRRQIQSRLDTRAFSYNSKDSTFFDLKNLQSGQYSLQSIVGEWSIEHSYRQFGASCWEFWGSRSGCIEQSACTPCNAGANMANFRAGLQLGAPQFPGCNNAPIGAGDSGLTNKSGYAFQFSHRWAGSMSMQGFMSTVKIQPDQQTDIVSCRPEPDECIRTPMCCETFWEYTPPLRPYFLPPVSFNPSQPQPSRVELIYGCTDPAALNYLAGANTDDGSCQYANQPGQTPTEPGSAPLPPPPPPNPSQETGCARFVRPGEKCYNLN